MENWTTYKNDLTNCGNTLNGLPSIGKIVWSYETIGEIYKDPLVVGQYVLLGCEKGFFYCINKVSGELVWKYNLNEKRPSDPVANNETVFFGAGTFLIAIDITTGKLKFKTPIGGYIAFQKPRIIDNKLIFGTSYLSKQYFFAIDIFSGNILWQFEETSNGEFYPALINNTDYIFSSLKSFSNECELTCIDLNKGFKKWSFKDKTILYPNEILNSFIHSTIPIITNGIIYFASLRKLFLIDPETGTAFKSISLPRTLRTHFQITLYNNNLYFTNKAGFVEFNLNKQKITNEMEIKASILTAPIASNHLIGFASISSLYIYDSVKMKITFEFKVPGTIYANPAYSDGKAFIATSSKMIHCLE